MPASVPTPIPTPRPPDVRRLRSDSDEIDDFDLCPETKIVRSATSAGPAPLAPIAGPPAEPQRGATALLLRLPRSDVVHAGPLPGEPVLSTEAADDDLDRRDDNRVAMRDGDCAELLRDTGTDAPAASSCSMRATSIGSTDARTSAWSWWTKSIMGSSWWLWPLCCSWCVRSVGARPVASAPTPPTPLWLLPRRDDQEQSKRSHTTKTHCTVNNSKKQTHARTWHRSLFGVCLL